MSETREAPIINRSPSSRTLDDGRRRDLLSCTVETELRSLEGSRERWDATVEEMGGPVYLTFDWLRTWWAFYGNGKRLRLFVFERGGRWVAVVPVYLETFWAGAAKTVVARLAGMHVPPKVLDTRGDTAWSREVFQAVIRRLFEDDGCDLLTMGYVTERWPAREALEAACEASPEAATPMRYCRSSVVTVFELPGSFADYLASLTRRERKKRRKRLRALERSYTIRSEVASEPAQMAVELERFLDQHALQWQARRLPGHFNAWPDGIAFHRALVRANAPLNRLRFFKLMADDEVVANRYTYWFADTLYSQLPSRSIGGEWDRLGIGSCATLKFFETAISRGVSRVDSGIGDFEHKVRLGGQQQPVGVWRVTNRRPSSRLKVWLLLRTSQLMKLVFHRIWWRRIVPRLPGSSGRTQSMFWLRFDI